MSQEFRPNRDEIVALIKLAEENLRLAKLEFRENFIRGAITKAYYVFLDTARAALLSKGLITRTHGSSLAKFGEEFVKSGIVAKEHGRWFNRALRARQEADYEALKVFDVKEAEEIIAQAEKFFNELKPLIVIPDQS